MSLRRRPAAAGGVTHDFNNNFSIFKWFCNRFYDRETGINKGLVFGTGNFIYRYLKNLKFLVRGYFSLFSFFKNFWYGDCGAHTLFLKSKKFFPENIPPIIP